MTRPDDSGRTDRRADDRPDQGRSTALPGAGSDSPGLFAQPPMAAQERMVEAMLFAASHPLSLVDLAERMPPGCDPAEALAHLARRYAGRGVVLERVGQGWAFRTAPDLGWLMSREVVETRRLSRAATETLAIIAYHQPVTRAEIEDIRGVAVSRGTIDQLMDLGWVRLGRRRQTPGRPVTFAVTEAFLDHFGLSSTRDLPGLAELRAAGLLQGAVPDGLFPDAADGEGPDPDQPELFDE